MGVYSCYCHMTVCDWAVVYCVTYLLPPMLLLPCLEILCAVSVSICSVCRTAAVL
jgi:hypothetical protein